MQYWKLLKGFLNLQLMLKLVWKMKCFLNLLVVGRLFKCFLNSHNEHADATNAINVEEQVNDTADAEDEVHPELTDGG